MHFAWSHVVFFISFLHTSAAPRAPGSEEEMAQSVNHWQLLQFAGWLIQHIVIPCHVCSASCLHVEIDRDVVTCKMIRAEHKFVGKACSVWSIQKLMPKQLSVLYCHLVLGFCLCCDLLLSILNEIATFLAVAGLTLPHLT